MAGCAARPPVSFQLTQTVVIKWQETFSVSVNNCAGIIPLADSYEVPLTGGSISAENLVANGGEPFRSIGNRIVDTYGESVRGIRLVIPAHTYREVTLAVTQVIYGGQVSGAIIDANKVIPGSPVAYSYHFTKDVTIGAYEDRPCAGSVVEP
jgi:hypothetical protein